MRGRQWPSSPAGRRRVLALFLLVLSALASAAGYLVLTGKIAAGERRFAEGRRQLEEGETALEEGKARLKAGKRKVAEGRRNYGDAQDNLFLVLADTLLRGGSGFSKARDRIAEGDSRISGGEDSIDVGERRVEAGRLELRLGGEHLRLAKGARLACAGGALLFASLSIVLGFRWMRANAGPIA